MMISLDDVPGKNKKENNDKTREKVVGVMTHD